MIEGRLRGPSTPSVGGGNVVVEQGLYLGHPLADFNTSCRPLVSLRRFHIDY